MPRSAEQNEIVINQRKNQILQVALKEFVKKGYAGAKTADIAQNTGISIGLLFRYFPTKGSLYTALLDYALSLSVANILSAVLSEGSPADRLQGIVESIFSGMENDKETAYNYALVIEASLFEDTPAEARELIKQADFVSLSMPLFIEGQKAGELKAGDPNEIATAFWGFVQGVALQYAASEGRSILPAADYAAGMIKK